MVHRSGCYMIHCLTGFSAWEKPKWIFSPVWMASDADAVAKKVSEGSGHAVSVEDVETVFAFLRNNHLVEADSAQHTWFERQLSQKPAFFKKVLKTYLFVRIPLVRPDRFLTLTLPWGALAWIPLCADSVNKPLR